MSNKTSFEEDDHRNFNREGEAFDRGETFAGMDFDTGLQAVDDLEGLIPQGATMPQFALRWILMNEAVSCAIPGAKKPEQVEDNARASELVPLSDEVMKQTKEVYERYAYDQVHQRW